MHSVKEEIKVSFSNGMVFYIWNNKQSVEILLELIKELDKATGIWWIKLITFLLALENIQKSKLKHNIYSSPRMKHAGINITMCKLTTATILEIQMKAKNKTFKSLQQR